MARTLSQKNGFNLALGASASSSIPAPSLDAVLEGCFDPRGGRGTFGPEGIGGGGRGAEPPIGGGRVRGPGFTLGAIGGGGGGPGGRGPVLLDDFAGAGGAGGGGGGVEPALLGGGLRLAGGSGGSGSALPGGGFKKGLLPVPPGGCGTGVFILLSPEDLAAALTAPNDILSSSDTLRASDLLKRLSKDDPIFSWLDILPKE